MGKKKTQQEFVNDVYNLVQDEYMVLGRYTSGRGKILMKHNVCGNKFEVQAKGFLSRKGGCPYCLKYKTKTTEQFKQEILNLTGEEYTVLGEYKNANIKIKFRHNKCNYEFNMIPNSFLHGTRCPKCMDKKVRISRTRTHENFVREVYNLVGNEYTILGQYHGIHAKVLIRHNKCNLEFEMEPNSFLSANQRCPFCNESYGEATIRQYLDKKGLKYLPQYKFNDCKDKRPLPFDFAIITKNRIITLIEYDGIQHYEAKEYFGGEKNLKYTQHHDSIKTIYCASNNIPLIRVPYTEKDIEKYLDYKLEHLYQEKEKAL